MSHRTQSLNDELIRQLQERFRTSFSGTTKNRILNEVEARENAEFRSLNFEEIVELAAVILGVPKPEDPNFQPAPTPEQPNPPPIFIPAPTPEPPKVSIPTPVPIPEPSQPIGDPHQIILTMNSWVPDIDGGVPVEVVERLRTWAIKFGWGINNIYFVDNQLYIDCEKFGSITVIAFAILIIAALAIVAYSVKSWKAVRLAGQETNQAEIRAATDITGVINGLDLPDNEKADLIEKVVGTYSGNGGNGGDNGGFVGDVKELALIGVGGLLLLQFAKKR